MKRSAYYSNHYLQQIPHSQHIKYIFVSFSREEENNNEANSSSWWGALPSWLQTAKEKVWHFYLVIYHCTFFISAICTILLLRNISTYIKV